MAELNLGHFAKTVEEPVYVAVGFGVLGFQRAQVLRRDVQRRVGGAARRAASMASAAGPRPLRRPLRVPAAGFAADMVNSVGPFVSVMAPVVAEVAGSASRRLAPVVTEAAERAALRFGPVLTEAAEKASERIAPIVAETADRLGEATERLPEEAQEMLHAAGELAKDIPGEAKALAKEVLTYGRSALGLLGP